jgi:catechol 2,3-dioxygenase-like lactoylglutathione lyase family enzyme
MVRMPAVIAGAHTIIYAEDAETARAFFREVLGFPSVDAGEGWLIFELPPGELALHPGPGWGQAVGHHELFLMCDDIERTVDELRRKEVEFVAPISDEGYGLMTRLKIPGGGEIGLYEPKHASPLAEFSNA